MIGVDAGATRTRVAVHALDGARLGYGVAGPGNPSARGVPRAVHAVRAALTVALGDLDPLDERGAAAGVAGRSAAFAEALTGLWSLLGLPFAPSVTNDVPIAYAAGTESPDGSLLLSGTGAVAARIAGRRVDAVADGLGWLLGDAGSGFWIGRAGAKAVVEALDRGETEGDLVALVTAFFLDGETGAGGETVPSSSDGEPSPDVEADASPRGEAGPSCARGGEPESSARAPGPAARERADRVVRLAQADHLRLAALSPLVARAAESGDPLAVAIVERAAERLAAKVARVYRGGPVVLAGSVLGQEGPVRRAVLELLCGVTERVESAGDAAGAAAWTAAMALDPGAPHAVFTRVAGLG